MYRSAFIKLVIFTAIIAVLTAIANFFIPALLPFQAFSWISMAFFFLVTAVTIYIGLNGLGKSSYGFVASVNGIVLLKLMLSVVLIIVYMLLARPKDPMFILPFFAFYICFTVFEVRALLIAQHQHKKHKK